MHRYFVVHKPYNMVSQFVSSHQVRLLGELDFDFPPDTHAIGRLDNLSEGLLLLTTNKQITRLLFEGPTVHKRTYMVQVKHAVTPQTLAELQAGVEFEIKGGLKYRSTPCAISIADEPPNLFSNGIHLHEFVVYTWLKITLTEGKYHQVRKMVNTVRHKCLRLLRISIEDLELGDLKPGGVREIDESAFFSQLKLPGKGPAAQE